MEEIKTLFQEEVHAVSAYIEGTEEVRQCFEDKETTMRPTGVKTATRRFGAGRSLWIARHLSDEEDEVISNEKSSGDVTSVYLFWVRHYETP